jgi:hypothetical protein
VDLSRLLHVLCLKTGLQLAMLNSGGSCMSFVNDFAGFSVANFAVANKNLSVSKINARI